MSTRAWPFEGKSEGVEKIRTPQDFLDRFGHDGTDAVVVRIGLNDAQLVLVDRAGRWDRWVLHSVEDAVAAARGLGFEAHVGEFPEETRVRMGKFQPDPGHYERAAYPEQGEVGAVIPYPENQGRRVEVAVEEQADPRFSGLK